MRRRTRRSLTVVDLPSVGELNSLINCRNNPLTAAGECVTDLVGEQVNGFLAFRLSFSLLVPKT